MLEYAEEEYRQLEKMYKADDLREETEKIVLRRAKNGVDRAKLELELAQASHEEAVKLLLPRTEESAKDQTERSLIDVGIHQDQPAPAHEQASPGVGETPGCPQPGRRETQEAHFRSRGDDRQGPHRRDRLLRPLGAGKVVGHERGNAPPRGNDHAQRSFHDRGADPAADHPHHGAGKPVAAGPHGPAGRRSAGGFCGAETLGRRRSAWARFPWAAAVSTAN